MRLITALLVKDEKDKYLERVLRRCAEFSDEVLVLDDGSTDGSDKLAWKLGCGVRKRSETGMWGNESPARSELWDWGARVAGVGGWLLICDADMLLMGDPRPLTLTTQHNAWAWVLYDLWDSESTYRADGYWMGHTTPRPWMFRPDALTEPPIWSGRGIHVGHCPANFPTAAGVAPPDVLSWLHLAYLSKERRLEKHQRYLAQSHQLSPFEKAHAESVAD